MRRMGFVLIMEGERKIKKLKIAGYVKLKIVKGIRKIGGDGIIKLKRK